MVFCKAMGWTFSQLEQERRRDPYAVLIAMSFHQMTMTANVDKRKQMNSKIKSRRRR